jgi:WXG100 family type VII secretion target
MTDEIRVDYAQLQQVATRFSRQATAVNQMQLQVKRSMGQLQSAWVGQGSSAFFTEMNDKVLPATNRLYRALQDAGKTTRQIAQLMEQAEREAAAPLRGSAISGTPNVGGGGGGGGGGAWGDGGSGGGSAGGEPSFWDGFSFKGKGKVWEFDRANTDQPSKFDPGVIVRYGVSGAVMGSPDAEGFSVLGGSAGAQAGVTSKGFQTGPYAEGYVAQAKTEGVWGDENLALTGGGTVKALAAEGFAGIRNNSLGASIGGTLISVKGEAGTNVAGVNVGVTGEVGLKAELGLQIGQETKLKLPFVTIGFAFGKAKQPDSEGGRL